MPTRSINALLLFSRRVIPLYPSSSPVRCGMSLSQIEFVANSRRWFTQDVRQEKLRYRNRTSDFKQKEINKASVTKKDEQLPVISFSPEELVPNKCLMLERIVKELELVGTIFILPKESEALKEILKPFQKLYKSGVKMEFLLTSCIAHPQLFSMLASKSTLTIQTLSTLVLMCQMSYEDAIRLISSFPGLASEHLEATLNAIISCGVPAGSNLGTLVKRCPPLVFARPLEEIQQAAQALTGFFSRKQISMIIQRCPDILLKNIDEIEEKYQYIFYQMGFEGEYFIDCSKWGSIPLEEIIMRHEFLVKCGRFRTPDHKHPQIQMENPSLRSILDTSEDNFANQIAQVTHEEWIIYQALCLKEREMATKEHPFIRIKPSMRKAYERRRKETIISPEHVFDVSASTGI